jgi:3-oxoacyl-[acyl-carrier-protein] synthase-1
MGIVSSIGNDTAEVTESLRTAKSGISFAQEHADHGFKCQVQARPNLDWETLVDRRAARFLSEGMGWGHIAMEQAIADSGLEAHEVSHERTGIIAGSGGPSTKAIVGAADKTRETGSPKRVGPFAVPKAMCSGVSAALATWFKIKGVNYSISSACATSAHCIGNAYESIAWGKQDVMFAGGSEDLDWTLCHVIWL